MPHLLTPLGRILALHTVLTSIAWWRAHLREAKALVPAGTHREMLRERADGWAELHGDGLSFIAAPGYGSRRFGEGPWTAFAARHGRFTPPTYWIKAVREIERMADSGADHDVAVAERRDGLRAFADRWDDATGTPVIAAEGKE